MSIAAEKPRIAHDDALIVAGQLLDALTPYCERIQIAGSLRRGKPTVGDIELVAIPRIERTAIDLFGTLFDERDLLHEHVSELRAAGVVADRPDKNGRPAWGRKLKRMVYQGMPVDLFTAAPANWGLILLIRTGPGDFNQRWVTPYAKGGTVLPFGMRVQDGWLWRGNTRIDCPEEIDVFTATGMAWLEPGERA